MADVQDGRDGSPDASSGAAPTGTAEPASIRVKLQEVHERVLQGLGGFEAVDARAVGDLGRPELGLSKAFDSFGTAPNEVYAKKSKRYLHGSGAFKKKENDVDFEYVWKPPSFFGDNFILDRYPGFPSEMRYRK